MAKFTKLTVRVPEINKTAKGFTSAKSQNIAMLKDIDRRFGTLAQKWGNVFEIDKRVLIAFIATESGGRANLTSPVGCCFGLMQVAPIAVFDVANKFRQTGQPLPEEVRQELAKIPNLLGKQEMSDATKNLIKNRLFDPNFNIMCGTMLLRWLLERFSTFLTGAQLNKAIIGYNAGGYRKEINTTPSRPIKTPVDTTTYIAMPTIPRETKNYLIKMMGVDGFLSLIFKDNAI